MCIRMYECVYEDVKIVVSHRERALECVNVSDVNTISIV